MNIKIDDLKFKIIKQVKEMLPGEIGVFLKNSHNIDDESDPIVLYRTTNDAEFDIINLSGLDSGFMFFDNPDAFVGMLENKDVVIDITEKKKAEIAAKNRDDQRKTAINAMHYSLEEVFFKESSFGN